MNAIVTPIVNPDLVDDRADALAANNLNGLRLALVELAAGASPTHADIELHFFTSHHLAAILADIAGDPVRARQVFRIRGGTRIAAGSAAGQVQVSAVSAIDATRLKLRVAPVGDYSTYTLELIWDPTKIDPYFSALGFKFRPGCFSNDCAPPGPGRPAQPGPAIDYLAKDYDSFRHTLMTAMAARVPGWRSSSEADLDQVLIDLFAAAADELSDYQDRVMGEAYLATTRKRVSLARHARLVDYHMHEGNQASTWLRLDVTAGQAPFTLADQEIVAHTGSDPKAASAVHFASRQQPLLPEQRQYLDPLLNTLHLHTWRNTQPALAAGSTSADLVPAAGLASQAAADTLRNLVRDGHWRELLIVERLNPLTGLVPGRNPAKRQLLRLRAGDDADDGGATSLFDPVTNTWLVRVHWQESDALRFDYSFTTFCPALVENVSIFHGNLVPVYEGRPLRVHFREPGTILPPDAGIDRHRHFQRWNRYGDGLDWIFAELPAEEGPLAYLPPRAALAAEGEEPARSTLVVTVAHGGPAEPWDEQPSLVHSDDSAENGDHLQVETDERRRTRLRFGNGRNGRLLPLGAVVHAHYQVGGDVSGNVGADRITRLLPLTGALAGALSAATNPFDVTDGRDPESAERVRRQAPVAFRARQLRAITLADYVRRAEEVPGVQRAVARYAWTGSWRTVRIAIDPSGFAATGDTRARQRWDELRPRVAAHLEAVRLIGEDLELRAPRYVPLDIQISVCIDERYWLEDLRDLIEQELSNRWTSDGRRGFFHADEWTFGQALHRSAIEGRLHRIPGVKHVIAIVLQRFNAPTPGAAGNAVLEMAADEVVLLANDADHLERGRLRLNLSGGRR
ncbi:baseplate J/gp47 family protein [Tahibacter sp.]|uniref:baseplate J/gp47 family protein n=1 Tax=Tahibacter sp. TaxID=2056211 RepID=UPI0028C3CC46|nr:baseplate J/gp47 family protein [Tahibacter sp.]